MLHMQWILALFLRHQLITLIARTFTENKLWVVNKGLMKQMNQGEWCDISF